MDFQQFAPGVYDNSALTLTDLEKEVLAIRSKDKPEETIGDAAKLIGTTEVR